jgi:dUTPase
MIIQQTEKAVWIKTEILNKTERAAGGFGHTGNQ